MFVKFELKPIKINNALFYENKDSLSLGIRKCQKHGKEVIEEWGIIIESGKNTKDTTKATIWLKADRKLLAMHGSGIIPIFKDTERKSLFFTDTEAPLNGYMKEHKITGQEIGYFIKTKDKKFSKVILSSPYEKSIPRDDTFCIEQGVLVKVIFQPDKTNLLKVKKEADLERLLLETY